MRSIVICEGLDDVKFLTYYLMYKCSWEHIKRNKIARKKFYGKDGKYLVANKDSDEQFYQKSDDMLLVCKANGKTKFNILYENLLDTVDIVNDFKLDNLFILTDNDDNDIPGILDEISVGFGALNVKLSDLQNMTISTTSLFNLIPIIVPEEHMGAIESIAIKRVESLNDDAKYIVKSADKYVDNVRRDLILNLYLTHRREVLKSKFMSVMSIINPTARFDKFSEVLASTVYYNSDIVDKCFGIVDTFASGHGHNANSVMQMNLLE